MRNAKAKTTTRALAPAADRLIDTAEQLFGQHGIEGVSLRQISTAAGSANNYAVQYHFGDLLGLIRAITRKRMPEIEALRAQLLLKAKEDGKLDDLRALLEIIHRPMLEYTNDQGERAYAKFILAALNSPIARNIASTNVLETMPIVAHVLDLISALHKTIPPTLLTERQGLITLMMLNSIFNRRTSWTDPSADAALIDNALDMATAALMAPVSPSTRSFLQ